MDAYHLHCIKPQDGWLSLRDSVIIVPHKDIEAVVSRVDINEFPIIQSSSRYPLLKNKQNIKELNRKRILKQERENHEMIVKKVLSGSKIMIPINFGVIFQDKKTLNNLLKVYYAKLKNILNKFKGKEEWHIRVCLRKELFLNLSKEELEKCAAQFFSVLKKASFESKSRGFIYSEKLFKNNLILNSFHLISERDIDKFVKNLNKLKENFSSAGFKFKLHGPYPPYHFVSL